jgi:hypothetical protein
MFLLAPELHNCAVRYRRELPFRLPRLPDTRFLNRVHEQTRVAHPTCMALPFDWE